MENSVKAIIIIDHLHFSPSGDHDGTAKLYLGGSLSIIKTNSMLEYRYIQGMNFTGLGEDKYVVVDLLTMDSLLSSCMCPTRYDVLVVDVEGAEVDVLNGYDIERHKPAWQLLKRMGNILMKG